MPRINAAMVAWGRTVAEPRLSPSAGLVAFLVTSGGRGALVVADVDGGLERVVTTDPPPTPSRAYGGGAFDWAGNDLVYAAVDGGLWLQPTAGGPPRRLVERGPCAAPAASPDESQVAYVVDGRHVAVVPLEEGGPWPVRLSSGADFALDPTWSPDGRWVAWHEWDVPNMPWDASRIVVRAADGSGEVCTVAGGEGVAVAQPRFAEDGRLGFLCDADGWLNLWATGPDLEGPAPVVKEAAEHGTASWGQGSRTFAWGSDGSVALARFEDGFGSLVVVDAEGEHRHLGRGVHGGVSRALDRRLVAVRSGARTPTEIVLYDLPSGERRTLAVGPVAGFEAARLVEPEVVTWDGPDVGVGLGTTVRGRLYRRSDERPLGDPPPLIMWVHGGPTDQWAVTFQPRIAYWVDRGWAVLLADHRGSTGHGRAYTQAMAGRWGELDTADVVAGLRAAGERGWGDPRRLVVMGGSAGGFAVLNVLAEAPGLCAAGVDLYGVADLFDLDETTHRFEAHYLHSVVGPLPEAADRYRERSPLNRAERIADPLLILQGDADEVVPPAQSTAIADRLRSLGRTVELHLYEGEGHGWGRPATVVDELERTEDFLRRHVLRWRQPT